MVIKRGRPEPGRLERGMQRKVLREKTGISVTHLTKLTQRDVQAYEKGWNDPELDRVYAKLDAVIKAITGLQE